MKDHYIVLLTTAPALNAATLALGSRLAAQRNAVLLFLHVVALRGGGTEAMLHTAVELAGGEDERWLRGLTPPDAGVRFRHRLEVGDAERAVLRFVAEHDVDLVIAEEPPRARLAHTLWRGVAERLVQHLPCPIVVGGPRFLQGRTGTRRPPPRAALHPTEAADLLGALVDARVEALRAWMRGCAEAAGRLAASLTVQSIVQGTQGPPRPEHARIERRMRVELDEAQRALRAVGWQLRAGERLWSSGSFAPIASRTLAQFSGRVQSEGQSTSLPLALDERLERLVILAGARPGEALGQGVLLLYFDAEDEFLRILGQPGPLDSLETYAFDDTGLMLSNSGFPEHLLEAGLLPADGAQTPLRLRVAEPSEGPIERWPLTRMARQATQHQDGLDLRGYRDYRGAEVIGAWRWVDEYGFGVAAEVDRRPAQRG